MQQQEKFDLWCVVELFGHQKIAGRCTEQNIAGTNMLRVDVPETKAQPSFTRFFGSSAIYAINPVDEETAKHYAEKLQTKPIEAWDINQIVKKHHALLAENIAVNGNAGDLDKEDWDQEDDDQ